MFIQLNSLNVVERCCKQFPGLDFFSLWSLQLWQSACATSSAALAGWKPFQTLLPQRKWACETPAQLSKLSDGHASLYRNTHWKETCCERKGGLLLKLRRPSRASKAPRLGTVGRLAEAHATTSINIFIAIRPIIRPLLLGWRPSLLGWRSSLVGWRPLLLGWRLGGHRQQGEGHR